MPNILGEESQPLSDADAELLCIRAIRRAADGDARWAAWWLEHHPSTSGTWSDAAVSGRIERDVTAKFIRALLAYGMSAHEQARFLSFMRGEGMQIAEDDDNLRLREAIERNLIARLGETCPDTELVQKIERRMVDRIVDVIKLPGMPEDARDHVLSRLRAFQIIPREAQV